MYSSQKNASMEKQTFLQKSTQLPPYFCLPLFSKCHVYITKMAGKDLRIPGLLNTCLTGVKVNPSLL